MATEVVFRTWRKGGTVLALFPGIDAGNGMCQSYEHVGQHGGADYAHCIAQTRPATLAEYAELQAELCARGYDDLRVCRRRPRRRPAACPDCGGCGYRLGAACPTCPGSGRAAQ